MSTHYVSPFFAQPVHCPLWRCNEHRFIVRVPHLETHAPENTVCMFSLQPEEPPLLLKMESRLSLFTIWRPERSLRLPHRHLISPPNSLVRQNRGPVHVRRFTFVRSVAGPPGREAISSFPSIVLTCTGSPLRVFFSPSLLLGGWWWARLPVHAAARAILWACFISDYRLETSKRKGSHHIWTGP